jgi:hypothetical protein
MKNKKHPTPSAENIGRLLFADLSKARLQILHIAEGGLHLSFKQRGGLISQRPLRSTHDFGSRLAPLAKRSSGVFSKSKLYRGR